MLPTGPGETRPGMQEHLSQAGGDHGRAAGGGGGLHGEERPRAADPLRLDVPIMSGVYRVLYEGLSPREAVQSLLDRPQKGEAFG